MSVVAFSAGLLAAPLRAQGTNPQIGLALGRTVPMGDFHQLAGAGGFGGGWTGLASVTLKRPSWPLGLRVEAGYSANGANDSLKSTIARQFGPPGDETVKLLGAAADLTYAFSSRSRLQPYVLGGVGLYHVTFSITAGSTTTDNSGTKLGWNLGAGLGYGRGASTLFLELRYVNVAGVSTATSQFPRTTYLPILLGVRFGGRPAS